MSKVLDILKEYRSLDLEQVVDFQKFSDYAIVHQSTAIEGSTLTDIETQLLLDEGRTPKGKPLEHSLMVKDHYAALQFILQQPSDRVINSGFIQQINAQVMKSTGSVYRTALGDVNAAAGEFRKGNVSAGGSYFVGYDKVPGLTKTFADNMEENMHRPLSDLQALQLSFSAHYDLVSIHPFYDGNGRTSRLVMNYVQKRFKLPMGMVFAEDRADLYPGYCRYPQIGRYGHIPCIYEHPILQATFSGNRKIQPVTGRF